MLAHYGPQLARIALFLLTMWGVGVVSEWSGRRCPWAWLARLCGTVGLACKLGAVMLTAYVVIGLAFRALGIIPVVRS